MNTLKTEAISENALLGCILFFHSLRAHKEYQVQDNIIRWLNSEWDHLGKFKDRSRPMLFTSWTFPIFTPIGTVLLLITINCSPGGRVVPQFLLSIIALLVAVPYQEGGWTCSILLCWRIIDKQALTPLPIHLGKPLSVDQSTSPV
jgi:hypothetical protein